MKVKTGEKMKTLLAHEDAAVLNGQVGSRLLDELAAHNSNEALANFYPPQLADMMTDKAATQEFKEFLSGNARGLSFA